MNKKQGSGKSAGKHLPNAAPRVSIIMGSKSNAEHLAPARALLEEFSVTNEFRVVSAHRTPELMMEFAVSARSRGVEVIIAGAGGAAHLPGMVASLTTLPVIGVPVRLAALGGLDSLLSIVQMPKGVPVATVAIGGAANAALLALRMLAITDETIRGKLEQYRKHLRTAATEEAP